MSNANTVSWVFAGAALVYLAGIATYLTIRKADEKSLSATAAYILGFICAISGGFCTYFFTGELGLNFQVPATAIKGNAAGGLATFALVMLLWLVGIVKPIHTAQVEEAKRLAKQKDDETIAAAEKEKLLAKQKKDKDEDEAIAARESRMGAEGTLNVN